jgi:uncharacterized protein YjbI with pentapeptide repeats
MRGVSFRRAFICSALFSGQTVDRTDFSDAEIIASDFAHVRFSESNRFDRTRFGDVDLSDTNLTAQVLRDAGAILCRVKFNDGTTVTDSCYGFRALIPTVIPTVIPTLIPGFPPNADKCFIAGPVL